MALGKLSTVHIQEVLIVCKLYEQFSKMSVNATVRTVGKLNTSYEGLKKSCFIANQNIISSYGSMAVLGSRKMIFKT